MVSKIFANEMKHVFDTFSGVNETNVFSEIERIHLSPNLEHHARDGLDSLKTIGDAFRMYTELHLCYAEATLDSEPYARMVKFFKRLDNEVTRGDTWWPCEPCVKSRERCNVKTNHNESDIHSSG